ncbi:MAG: tRNA 2-thiouridine(34) synthase MnmA [Chloroflexota bacterium]
MSLRVVAAMSGGVDSSVAAALLKNSGYEVTGIYLRLWPGGTTAPGNRCCSDEALEDARRVCQAISIPFYVLNFEDEFRNYVVEYYTTESARGRTPNPCIVCNRHLKFGFLMSHAVALKADFLATGHYARITQNESGYHLLKGKHHDKDQSYVLYTLDQTSLARILFPLGEMTKAEVREIAQVKSLPVSDKPESQDLCFLYAESGYVPTGAGDTPGEIVDTRGKILGKHRGIAHYTIGQRHGLNVTVGHPVYVIRIDAGVNRVIVGGERDLLHKRLIASQLSWVSGRPPQVPVSITAKIRYKSPEAPATLKVNGDTTEVTFNEPQRAITPGQAVVFYQGEEVLGGGAIETVTES